MVNISLDLYKLPFSLLVVLSVLISCSKNDEDFHINFSASIVEEGNNSNAKVTNIIYKNMGGGEGDDGEFGTGDDDIHMYYMTKTGEFVENTDNAAELLVVKDPGGDDVWFTEDDQSNSDLNVVKLNDIGSYYKMKLSPIYSVSNDNPFYNDFHSYGYRGADGITYFYREETLSPVELLYLGRFGEIGVDYNAQYELNTLMQNNPDQANCCLMYQNYSNVSRVYKKIVKEGAVHKYFLRKYPFQINASLEDLSIDSVQKIMVDNLKNESIAILYGHPGTDGLWSSDDDFISNYSITKYLDDPLKSEVVYYETAGDDKIWLTDDDLILSLEATILDSEGRVLQFSHRTPGLDGILSTSDDFLKSYRLKHISLTSEIKTEVITLVEWVDNLGLDNEFIPFIRFKKYEVKDGKIVNDDLSLIGTIVSTSSSASRLVREGSETGFRTRREFYHLGHEFINLANFDPVALIDELLTSPTDNWKNYENYENYEIETVNTISESKTKKVTEIRQGDQLLNKYTHMTIKK